jgi:hypothetical protein
MAELQFSTDQIRAEINGMANLADEFLERSHSHRLRQAAYSLGLALKSGGVWQIPQNSPLQTLASEREAGSLFGRLSFKWEVRPVTPHRFCLGNGSTTIEIRNRGSSAPLVSWNTDIGGRFHPGYQFHVQILSGGKSMEVPRLPSILLTPTDCLDFLLGELFQKQWTMHQYEKRGQTAGWTQGVRSRICHLLHQKAERAGQSNGITPWMNLKTWELEDPEVTFDK